MSGSNVTTMGLTPYCVPDRLFSLPRYRHKNTNSSDISAEHTKQTTRSLRRVCGMWCVVGATSSNRRCDLPRSEFEGRTTEDDARVVPVVRNAPGNGAARSEAEVLLHAEVAGVLASDEGRANEALAERTGWWRGRCAVHTSNLDVSSCTSTCL